MGIDGSSLSLRDEKPGARRYLRSRLQRERVVPLYYQLEAVLQERIVSGHWKPGDEIPSERELCVEFGVSRTVVRAALDILEREGLLVRDQGRRTRVGPPKTLLVAGGLLAILCHSRGKNLSIEVMEGASHRSEGLTFSLPSQTIALHAVVLLDGEPICLCRSVLATEPLRPVLQALEEGRLPPPKSIPPSAAGGRIEAELEIGSCTEFEAEALEIAAGDPVFVAHGTHFARLPTIAAEVPVEDAFTVYRAAAVKLSLPSQT